MTQHSHSVEPEHTELLSGTPSGELAAGSVVALQPGQRAEKPPPAPPDAVHQHRISEVQASVYGFCATPPRARTSNLARRSSTA